MGTPQAAAVALERLVRDGHHIAAVYTQPDRPSGRGNKVTSSPVKEFALANDLTVYQPQKIRTHEALDEFRSHVADVAVVVAYGRILPEDYLHAFRYGALNVHYSLLPKYRGAAPVNWAIVNGEVETGVTIMQMDSGLDTGDILLQGRTRIGDDETAIELMERLSYIGADLLAKTLSDIDRLTPQPQNDSEATFAPMLKKEDGLVDWFSAANVIERRIRGFQPFPSSYTFYHGDRLTIWRAKAEEKEANAGKEPGTVVEANGERLVIACGDETRLSIYEIQPEGRRRMSVRDFLNGTKIKIGAKLENGQKRGV